MDNCSGLRLVFVHGNEVKRPARCLACGMQMEQLPDDGDGFGPDFACGNCGWEGEDPAEYRHVRSC